MTIKPNFPRVKPLAGFISSRDTEKSRYEKSSEDKSFNNLREVDSGPNLPRVY